MAAIIPPAGEGKSDPPNKALKDEFLRVAKIGSAFGFGFMAASIQALKKTSGHLAFEVSFWTIAAFAAGVLLAIVFWKLALDSNHPKNFRKGLWLTAIFGVGAFLYPLRFIPRENMLDHLVGLSFAILVLAAIGFVFLKIKRYLDEDFDTHQNK